MKKVCHFLSNFTCRMVLVCLVLFLPISVSAETPKGDGFWYTIKWGDTILDIANKYQIDPGVLVKVNNLTDVNTIYAGYRLWIPKQEMIEVYVYKVSKGETLLEIARKFETDLWEIASINNIYNLNLILENQTIYIPVKKSKS